MLVFARHGECVANSERRYVGRGESPLTERGRRQADRLGAALAGDPALELARIVSSPLERARHTAAAVASALGERRAPAPPVVVDERFTELDYGELEGAPIGDGRGRAAAVEAEPLDRAAARVGQACASLWSELAGSPASLLVVSHVVPIKLAVCWALEIPPPVVWKMALAVASLTRISTAGAEPTLESYNEQSFLGEDRSPRIWR